MVAKFILEIGKCFVTPSHEMRKIIGLPEGKVTYESWSSKLERPKGSLHSHTKTTEKFYDEVDREVPCTYRKEFGVNQA